MKKSLVLGLILIITGLYFFPLTTLGITPGPSPSDSPSAGSGSGSGGGSSGAIEIDNPLTWKSFAELTNSIINYLFYLALAITPLIIVIAGYYLLTSGGDPQKVKKAKDIIIWALVGLVVVFLSAALVSLLKKIIGVK